MVCARMRSQATICFASTGPPSNPSILYSRFPMFPTISGNLLLARSKPRHHNSIGFWHSFGTAGFENRWGEPLSLVVTGPVSRLFCAVPRIHGELLMLGFGV